MLRKQIRLQPYSGSEVQDPGGVSTSLYCTFFFLFIFSPSLETIFECYGSVVESALLKEQLQCVCFLPQQILTASSASEVIEPVT